MSKVGSESVFDLHFPLLLTICSKTNTIWHLQKFEEQFWSAYQTILVNLIAYFSCSHIQERFFFEFVFYVLDYFSYDTCLELDI